MTDITGGAGPVRYDVRVYREEGFWMVEIPALDGLTQALKREDVDYMARDYIATVTDSDEPVELVVRYDVAAQ